MATNNATGYGVGNPKITLAPVPIASLRNPATSDTGFPLGQIWDNKSSNTIWILSSVVAGVATWVAAGSGATGGIVTISGDSGGAESPLAGNFNILGTANQITVTGTAHTETIHVPTTFIAPGSIASTTTNNAGTSMTAGTTITATLGAITATNGNLVLGTAGNKIISTSVASTTTAGANSFGKVTLVGGTATVSTTAVTASSIIILTRQGVGATGAAALGQLSIGTISAGASFIINAWQVADATALQASDVSSIGWMIIN